MSRPSRAHLIRIDVTIYITVNKLVRNVSSCFVLVTGHSKVQENSENGSTVFYCTSEYTYNLKRSGKLKQKKRNLVHNLK